MKNDQELVFTKVQCSLNDSVKVKDLSRKECICK
jgi:hypothetical protein